MPAGVSSPRLAWPACYPPSSPAGDWPPISPFSSAQGLRPNMGSSLSMKPANISSVNKHHKSVRADARFAQQSASNQNGVKWKPEGPASWVSGPNPLGVRIFFLALFKRLAVSAETTELNLSRKLAAFVITPQPCARNVHIHARVCKNKSSFCYFFSFKTSQFRNNLLFCNTVLKKPPKKQTTKGKKVSLRIVSDACEVTGVKRGARSEAKSRGGQRRGSFQGLAFGH